MAERDVEGTGQRRPGGRGPRQFVRPIDTRQVARHLREHLCQPGRIHCEVVGQPGRGDPRREPLKICSQRGDPLDRDAGLPQSVRDRVQREDEVERCTALTLADLAQALAPGAGEVDHIIERLPLDMPWRRVGRPRERIDHHRFRRFKPRRGGTATGRGQPLAREPIHDPAVVALVFEPGRGERLQQGLRLPNRQRRCRQGIQRQGHAPLK
jgi:hypothetical protein